MLVFVRSDEEYECFKTWLSILSRRFVGLWRLTGVSSFDMVGLLNLGGVMDVSTFRKEMPCRCRSRRFWMCQPLSLETVRELPTQENKNGPPC